jgi:di/tricarboxylate transporter
MIDIGLTGTGPAWATIAIVAGMFVLFVRESRPPEVVAMGGAGLMLVLGLLPIGEASAVLSNAAPWTIAFMFVLMGGLVRTGALALLTQSVDRNVAARPRRTIAGLYGSVAGASAVMNNTPVVAVMIPVVVQLAKKIGTAPSKLLIPLSYMTVMGGMMTLIGTSTNLLVDGVARSQGLEPFGIFEILPLGLVVVIAGAAYLWFVGRHLLPERDSLGAMLSDRKKMKFFTEVALPEGSALVGRKVVEVEIFKRDGMRVVDVLRGDASLRRDLAPVVLEAGDRVVLRTEVAELLGLQKSKDVALVDKLSSVQTATVEVLITPGCRMIGRTLGELRLRRRYGVYPLAVHRRNRNIGARMLDEVEVQVGDTLLLEGAPADIARLAEDQGLVDISQPAARAYRRTHAPIAIGALVAVVGLSALNVAPIQVLAFLGVVVILLTRCIDPDEAFGFIEARLMALIFAMIAVGAAMDHTGAVQLIVDGIAPFLRDLPPWAALGAVLALTLTLTEFLSNNAIAVILTPIAIQLGISLGLDPRPFAVAVMFGASLAFATPIGYQTNMMVFAPGGYRFTDYLKVGIPLNLVMLVVVTAVLPLIWPL